MPPLSYSHRMPYSTLLILYDSKIDPTFVFPMLFVLEASFLYDTCSAVELVKPPSSIDDFASLNFPALLTPLTGSSCLIKI